MCADKREICIDRFHPDETETLLSLYIDLFYDREPLTKCIGLGRERMIEVARSIYLQASADPVARWFCWIARDHTAANKPVGFIFCDDPAAQGNQHNPENFTNLEQENFSVLLDLMQAIRKPEKDRIGTQAGRCLHIAAIGVSPGYEGAGIATKLLQIALADATTRGFAYAFSECTNIASQKCHEKNGFKNIHSISVKDFLKNNPNSFLGSDINICLLWKDL
jgi:ribosomal protein S18 acetylase RimI-like enzyme